MKAYIATTGALFTLLVAVHVLRVVQETHLARDPWYVFATLVSLGMALWAFRLFRKTART